MNATSDPIRFFTGRSRSYARFIRLFRYQQGLRACFMKSPLLRSGMRVLDAGCGTGAVLLALREAIVARGFVPGPLHGFDITPAMLDHLHASLWACEIEGIELMQADVLALETLPAAWSNYDFIVSASMLEYVPREQFVAALSGLHALLNENGSLLLFITRDNWLMRPLIGQWWQSNLYTAQELKEAFAAVGFSAIELCSFPPLYRYLALWGHVIQARR